MKIMTARKLAFYSADRTQKFMSAGNRIIEECPDWAAQDAMFKAAEKAGVLTRLAEQTSTKEEVAIQEAAPANSHEVANVEGNASEEDPSEEIVEDPSEVVAEEEPVKVTKKTSKKK